MGNFNQAKYQADWDKKNMKTVLAKYKAEFVDEFKEACKILDLKQSQVFREAMEETIQKAKSKK